MATFTPSNVVDKAKEKDWAANLGMMDWDSTRIVFTKRTLIEFLKYTGTTVDTNFSNIQKLPRYATFGKIEGDEEPSTVPASSSTTSTTVGSLGDFKPSRRVRTAPGGETHDIFGHYVDDDALASAPSRGSNAQANETTAAPSITSQAETSAGNKPEESRNTFRPTRRVREMPGGKDSIADLL